jgi:hypothetical protein
MNQLFEQKYLKYKAKYLTLKKQIGGELPAGRKLIEYNQNTNSIVGYNIPPNNAVVSRYLVRQALHGEFAKISVNANKIMFIIRSTDLYFIQNTNRRILKYDDGYIILENSLDTIVKNISRNERLANIITIFNDDEILLSELLTYLKLHGDSYSHLNELITYIRENDVDHDNFFIKIIDMDPNYPVLGIDEVEQDWS